MPEHPEAAERIRARLADGLLPPADIKRVIVLRGSGGTSCAACRAPITAGDNRALVDRVGAGARLEMHSACVAIWQFQSSREV
jgi:hypothetical protein